MRKVIVDEWMALDGVVQAPGHAQEDNDGGEVEDLMTRQFQQGYFGRNVIMVGACLVMFAFFASSGDSIRYAITGSAFTL